MPARQGNVGRHQAQGLLVRARRRVVRQRPSYARDVDCASCSCYCPPAVILLSVELAVFMRRHMRGPKDHERSHCQAVRTSSHAHTRTSLLSVVRSPSAADTWSSPTRCKCSRASSRAQLWLRGHDASCVAMSSRSRRSRSPTPSARAHGSLHCRLQARTPAVAAARCCLILILAVYVVATRIACTVARSALCGANSVSRVAGSVFESAQSTARQAMVRVAC